MSKGMSEIRQDIHTQKTDFFNLELNVIKSLKSKMSVFPEHDLYDGHLNYFKNNNNVHGYIHMYVKIYIVVMHQIYYNIKGIQHNVYHKMYIMCLRISTSLVFISTRNIISIK